MLHNQAPAPEKQPSDASLRRDSVRPRTDPSTDTIEEAEKATLLKALALVMLSLAALRKGGETPVKANSPDRAASISRLVLFARDAYTAETFDAELARADARLPGEGALDATLRCVGLWLYEAVRVLAEGGLGKDAADLRAACLGLREEGVGSPGMGLGSAKK